MTLTCPSCGFSNPPAMRFCGQCGTRLEAAAPAARASFSPEQLGVMMGTDLLERFRRAGLEAAGQRRSVTILFADLAGYTDLSERQDPEDLFDLLRQVLRVLANAVYRYEGAVDKFIGDGLMALFGAPIAQENNAERAVRCAWDMQTDLARFLAEQPTPLPTALGLHVGIHTGPVIVGSLGSNMLMNYTAIGDTVNLARRLQEASNPGAILVSERVWQQTLPLFDFEALAPQALKGISQPVAAYQVVGPRERPDPVRGVAGLRAPMIGRGEQLGALRGHLSALIEQRHGRFVLVTGEAGLGKSRLAAELKGGLLGAPLRVLEGQSVTYRRSTPYWLFVDLLRGSLDAGQHELESSTRDRLRARVEAVMGAGAAEALPYLEHLLSLRPSDPQAAARLSGLAADQLRQRVFLAVREYLLAEAQWQPLLLVLEDLHWADEVSLELLQGLLGIVTQAPVLIVALSRPAADGPLAGLNERARQQLGEHFAHLPLSPLAPEESRQLLAELLASPQLPEGLRDQILERAAGVPFYLEEILRMLIDAGTLGREAGTGRWRVVTGAWQPVLGVPDTLQGLILTRFDRLAEVQRRALQVATVIGLQFSQAMVQAVLARLVGSAQAGFTQAEIAAALSQLTQREFITPLTQPAAELEYGFKHTLVSDAIYSTLLRQERLDLHGLVGETMEALFAGSHDEHVEELARHFSNSQRQDRALHYLLLAGQKAARGNAIQPARSYFEQAVGLLESVTHTPPQALAARSGLGQALLFVGAYDPAREQLLAGLAALGSAPLSAELKLERSRLERLLSRIDERQGNHDDALLWLASALAGLDELTPPAPVDKAQVLHDIGWIHFRRGSLANAQQFLTQALALVETEPAYEVIASIYNRLGGLAYSQGDWTASADYVRKSIVLREAIGDVVSLANSFNNLGVLELEMGQYDSALENLDRSLALKRRQGQADGVAVALNNLGLLRVRRGELEAARADLAEARQVAQQIGYSSLLASVLMHLGELHLAAEEWAAAQAALAEGARLFEDLGVPDQLLEMQRLMGEAALAVDDVDAAALCQARMTALYAELGNHAARLSTLQRGEYERFGGRLALYQGRWSEAQQRLRASADTFRSLGNRFYQGRITTDLGLLAERQGDHPRAQLLYREASLLFQSVGARQEAARVEAALSRLRPR